MGMNGPQAISIVDVMAWCMLAGVMNPADRIAILRCVQAMDGEYLKYVAEQQKRRGKG